MKKIVFAILLSLAVYATHAQLFDVDTIQYNGSIDTMINLVILGDGYTLNQLDQFEKDARHAADALFNEIPFSNYRNYFNVFLIKVPSDASGAANSPDELILNYYGSTYNAYYGIERLLVPMRTAKITSVLASNFPFYDQVIMIVNDSRYGGSGGWVATFSTNNSSLEIFLHELGHSFASLADEYWAGEQYAREAINMSKETNPALVIWKNWYGNHGIGIYPHSESPSWHRPHQNCKLRFLGVPYCAVCKEGIIERIHSLVSPLISYEPRPKGLNFAGNPISFKLNLVRPEPNTLQVNWTLNNSELDVNTDSVIIDSHQLAPGQNYLQVTIEDTTELLRVDKHPQIHITHVAWSIEKTTTGIETTSSGTMNIRIYPNPFQNRLIIKNEPALKEDLTIEIADMTGRIYLSQLFRPQESYSLNVESLQQGYYIISLYAGGKLIASRQIVRE